MSFMLATPDCPFKHPTCPKYTYLYGSLDDPGVRMMTYEPYLLSYGEIAGEGKDPYDPVLFPLLRVRRHLSHQWQCC